MSSAILPSTTAESQAPDRRALVARLEDRAARDPGSYLFRIGALATLGYAYVVAVLGCLVAAIWYCALVNPAFIWLEIGLLPLLVIVVRSLTVSSAAPRGLPLEVEQVPELYALVDEIAVRVKAARIDSILLNDETSAAVLQMPLLSPFGPFTNHLVLGLPLLQSLDPDEFRAILSHELAHVSRMDGRFDSRIHRLRSTWRELALSCAGRRSNGLLLRRFLGWYVPYFEAYTLVWARVSELRADDVAMMAVDAPVLARALAKRALLRRFMEEMFWPHVHSHASTRPEPPPDAFLVLGASVDSVDRWVDHCDWRAELCREPAVAELRYPSFAARAEALSCVPEEIAAAARFQVGPTAASAYLGSAADELAGSLSLAWATEAAPVWTERHRAAAPTP